MKDTIEDTVLFYANDTGKRLRHLFIVELKLVFPRVEVRTKNDSSWSRALVTMPYCSAGRYIDYMIRIKLWGSSTYCCRLMAGNSTMIPPKGVSNEAREADPESSEISESQYLQEVDHPKQENLFA
jgi:hypothetical protein